jgi:hypothetical protein
MSIWQPGSMPGSPLGCEDVKRHLQTPPALMQHNAPCQETKYVKPVCDNSTAACRRIARGT